MTEQVKCSKCGRMRLLKGEHFCYPALMGLGTQQIMSLKGSRLGSQVDGNVELAYHRARQVGRDDARRLLKQTLKYVPKNQKRLREKIEKF